MALKKYNNLLTSRRSSKKDPKDSHILALVGVAQNLVDDSKKSSENLTHPAGSKLREIHPTSGTSLPGYWNIQKL